MKKSMKRLLAAALGSAILILTCQSSALAQAEKYVEDIHYFWLPIDVKVDPTSEKAGEVVEFFSYGCPHCNDFDPYLSTWKQTMPANVNFIQSPVSFGRESWGVMATGKHIADKLEMSDSMHDVFFDAVHNKRIALNTFEELQALFAEQGVDKETFYQTAESLQVQAAFKKSEQSARNYAVSSVPSVMVNGHWMINSQNLSSFEEVFDVVEFLLVKDGIDIDARINDNAEQNVVITETVIDSKTTTE